MPIFQKIFVGEMAALDHEAMGAYYAAMARQGYTTNNASNYLIENTWIVLKPIEAKFV